MIPNPQGPVPLTTVLTTTPPPLRGPWPIPDPGVWALPLDGWLGRLPSVWREAWTVVRQTAQGGPSPALNQRPDLWASFCAEWSKAPEQGQRFAWSVGSRGWAPPLKMLVEAGLITVPALEKPRADQHPERLAERVESKHPALLRWLIDHGEPADAPWRGGSFNLRRLIHAHPHKKLVQLWLSRPDERSPEHLGQWISTMWRHNVPEEIQVRVWSAWDQALAPLALDEQAACTSRASQRWAEQVIAVDGWPTLQSGGLSRVEPLAMACWDRWQHVLGDHFFACWQSLLVKRYDENREFRLSPRFAQWFDAQSAEVFRRHEQEVLTQTVADHQDPEAPTLKRPPRRL